MPDAVDAQAVEQLAATTAIENLTRQMVREWYRQPEVAQALRQVADWPLGEVAEYRSIGSLLSAVLMAWTETGGQP